MKNNIKFKNVSIYIIGANGEPHLYHENNEYKNTTEKDICNIFNLEPLHYASVLDGENIGTYRSFNTYNWNAPYVLCGVMPEDIYGVSIVNVHLGGDARGNYSAPYICEETESVVSQTTFLDIELSNGDIFTFDCENGEAYFDFDTFDPYYIDFSEKLTLEQLTELKEKKD